MAYNYIHIVENYFVKPSRGGYVLGTLQTKKGGRRSLMNGITYGSLTEAMEVALFRGRSRTYRRFWQRHSFSKRKFLPTCKFSMPIFHRRVSPRL